MRILQINNCFPVFSTGKIVSLVHDALCTNGEESYVAYAWDNKHAADGKRVFRYGILLDKYISAALTRITGTHLGNAHLSTAKLLRIIKKLHPDIVHIHCANCYSCNHYRLFSWCRKNSIKMVVTEHAEYYYTGNCSFVYECEKWMTGCGSCPNLAVGVKSRVFDLTARNWKRMYNAFSGWGNNLVITGVSPWITERSLKSPITNRCRHVCIENSVNTDLFQYIEKDNIPQHIQELFDERTILFIAPGYLSGVKGGNYLFALARRMPSYKFVVVGVATPKDSPDNIHFVEHTTNQKELAMYYSCARITLLTSKRETFSLVTAESLSCGTPVVGFQSGGPETIALTEFSEFVERGNLDALEAAVKKWLDQAVDKKWISEIARKRYSAKRMTEQYINIYRELMR